MSNRERIERLEDDVRTINANVNTTNQAVARIERMMRRMNFRNAKRSSSSSSSEESVDSDAGSEWRNDFAEHEDDQSQDSAGGQASRKKDRPKLFMSTFDGTDPISWLSRANQYFDLNDMEKSERVRYAAYYLEGEANIWWQWISRVYRKRNKKIQWRHFEKELMARFGPTDYMNYNEALSHIKQTGSLREYQKEFERIASRVKDWPEKALVGAFVGGMKPELATEVRVFRPKTFLDAVEMARIRDDHLQAQRRNHRTETRRPLHSPTEINGPEISSSGSVVNKTMPSEFKRLSWEEMQQRREKGLCFNCEEKFRPGHVCKMKHAFLIEPAEDTPMYKDSEGEKGEIEIDDKGAEISIHAIGGTHGPKTMKIPAWVNGKQVIVLIDTGSSHNFINSRLAQILKLPVSNVDSFDVRVASGDRLSCQTIYRDIPIKLQGITVRTDLFALPLAGPDVVLGVQWLEGLGPIVSNYKEGTMEFVWGDGRVKLVSVRNPTTEVGQQNLEKLQCKVAQCYAIQIDVAESKVVNDSVELKKEPTPQKITTLFVSLEEKRSLTPKKAFLPMSLTNRNQPINMQPYSGKSKAHLLVDHVIKLRGVPCSMRFLYRQQPNGYSEMTNGILEQYLRCFVCQTSWRGEEFLSWAEYWYDDTWENLDAMRLQFPNFILEDKDLLEGDGNDADEGRILRNTYNRARRLCKKKEVAAHGG